jgi:hypothetical protein
MSFRACCCGCVQEEPRAKSRFGSCVEITKEGTVPCEGMLRAKGGYQDLFVLLDALGSWWVSRLNGALGVTTRRQGNPTPSAEERGVGFKRRPGRNWSKHREAARRVALAAAVVVRQPLPCPAPALAPSMDTAA